MIEKIKSISLILENTDSISFNKNVIGYFLMDKIEQGIFRIASNCISKEIISKEIFIEIFKEGNEQYNEMNISNNKKYKFDRLLSCSDITSIEVHYENNDKVEEYYVYGEYDSYENNNCQKTFISEVGNLYILIDSQKREIKEYIVDNKYICDLNYNVDKLFNDEKINIQRKNLYDIGKPEVEKHKYSKNDLPELYKLVILVDESTKQSYAYRVYDRDCGWKFIFENKNNAINFPQYWYYVEDDLENLKRITSMNNGISFFVREQILKKYPPFNLLRR